MEALGTELAAEGLEASVLAAVGDEVGALAEGFATYLAFVGLLPCRAEKMVRKILADGGNKLAFSRLRPDWLCLGTSVVSLVVLLMCLHSPPAAEGEKNQRLDNSHLLVTQRTRILGMLRASADSKD